MGSRHLPEAYVEVGRWGLQQVTAADILLAITFGLSVPTALLILGSLFGGSDDADVTISAATFVIGIAPGFVMGVVLHELVHGVFFLAFGGRPRCGFKPWTRLGPVFNAEIKPPQETGRCTAGVRCESGGATDFGRSRLTARGRQTDDDRDDDRAEAADRHRNHGEEAGATLRGAQDRAETR